MKILVVDDEKSLAKTMTSFLKDLGHEVECAFTGADGRDKAASFHPDVVLLDVHLPDILGLEVLEELKAKSPSTVVLMVTGSGTVKHAVEAMRRGAEDYLTKPLNLDELQVILEKTAANLELRQQVADLKDALRSGYAKDYLFLPSPAMSKAYAQIEKVASQDKVTVLVLGETGTGKEHVARLIHLFSPRSAKPFVELHCGAFPETLLESELFGFEAGAFTDARKQKKGLFETAQGGTVFLDEVGEMPLSIQTKLLKVLEQKTLRRLGGVQEIQLDVRVISATNRDLERDVKDGKFRADLFYRLNVFPIEVPPLRERPQDVNSLIQFFYQEACKAFAKKLEPLPAEILEGLQAYPWPGNTRELKNALNRLVLNADGKSIKKEDVPVEFLTAREERIPVGTEGGDLTMADAEKRSILRALEHTGGNRSLAARELGISRNTLLNKIKRYNLE
jgi:DNA-binding NtrC family response regulator